VYWRLLREKNTIFPSPARTPYANQLKRQITIRLDATAVNYFKEVAAELGMPYQNLINLFLRDCAMQKRHPVIQWPREAPKRPVDR
jgi:predicted DNA binding CopG/RHH family protein